jgi:hypothetical protein
VERVRSALDKASAKGNAQFEYRPIDGGVLRQTSLRGLGSLLKGSKRREAGMEALFKEAQRNSSARACELSKELKLQREFTCHLQCVLGIVP